MARLFEVDMKSMTVKESHFPKEWLLYGGRGLTSKLLSEMVTPTADPLGPDNLLLVCPLVLGGTVAPSGNRVSFGYKSPLTGGIKESNTGGMFGHMLGLQNVRAIIIKNKPEEDDLWMLYLDAQGKMHLRGADKYAGMNNYGLQEELRKDFGENIATATIGAAGERQYLMSSIAATEFITNHPTRHAGRGGGGAVMGSKRLKAIIIEKPATQFKYPYADKEFFMATLKRHQEFHKQHPLQGIQFIGTSGNIGNTAKMGVLPVRNFSGDLLEDEKFATIDPAVVRETNLERGGKFAQRCMPGCIGLCSNEIHDKDGKSLTGSLEYETVAMCGPNCDITDYDFIALQDRFCDDIGIDTIEFGTTVGVAMDIGAIKMGDMDAVRKIMDEMYRGEGLGAKIAEGTERYGRSVGSKRIPAIKGQAIAAYDPRTNKGTGITYSTSSMGADHTAGLVLGPPGADLTSKDGKIMASMSGQLDAMLQDYYMCTFNWGSAMSDPTVITDYVKGAFGIDVTFKNLQELGVETLLLEDEFNKGAGFTIEDDDVPEFFRKEHAKFNNAVFDFTLEELQSAKRYEDLLK